VEELQRAAAVPAMSRYGFGLGLVRYREAIAGWMARRFGTAFDPMTEVVPLIGSKEGLAHVAFAFCGPGDTVVIPEPAYQAYVGGTLLSDATPYVYPLRSRTQFLVELDEIPAEVLERARILYLNYPNNPTAAIAPREYLERVVNVCRERDILLVYDNAYSEMGFDGYVPLSIFEIDGARDVAIEFHSLSKTYNMTGWRCGWAVAKPEIAGALAKVKSFTDTGQFMGIQSAGVAAIESWAEFVPGNVATFQARRDAAVAAFRANGFQADVPRATMYLWMPLPSGIASRDFADRLREEQGVIVLPGSGFGAGGEGFFRISFIQSPERIAEAARRAGAVLASMMDAANAPGSARLQPIEA
jgi:LL-diaminopimelate aminotransferase